MKFGTKILNPARFRLMIAIATAIFVFFLGRHFVATYSLSAFLSTGDLHEYLGDLGAARPTWFSRSFHFTDAHYFSCASPSVEQQWINEHADVLVCLLSLSAAYIVWKVLAASRRELIAILLGIAVGAIFAIVGCCIPEFQQLNLYKNGYTHISGEEIRKMAEQGLSKAEIARRLGLDISRASVMRMFTDVYNHVTTGNPRSNDWNYCSENLHKYEQAATKARSQDPAGTR
jgi:hypothetical protein